MLRSLLTLRPNSPVGVVLLVPCLLICLACATPFPIENLEEGMTTEAVRGEFGEPESIEPEPGGAESTWTYVHEERSDLFWPLTVMFSTVFLPHCMVISAWTLTVAGEFACIAIDEKDVFLHFEGEKLARWHVIGPYYSGDGGFNPFDPYYQSFWDTDAGHHQKGHTHHHQPH